MYETVISHIFIYALKMSLCDLVTDLINEAKVSNDSNSKVFALEQVKEIVFHRNNTMLVTVLPDLSDFVLDKSASVKLFLVGFYSMALKVDLASSVTFFLGALEIFINENNEKVSSLIIKELSTFYGSIIMYMSSVSVESNKVRQAPEPVAVMWTQLKRIRTRIGEVIGFAKTDQLKAACLQFYEVCITFGLPASHTIISDPRRAKHADPRLMKEVSNKSADLNAESIALHHPIISRNELVQDAEDLYARLLLWASTGKTGGSHGGSSFSPTIMAHLGRIISDIACIRPAQCVKAAKALGFLFQGKGNVTSQMTVIERDIVARAAHRLLRSAVVQSHSDQDGSVQRLRHVLESFETTADLRGGSDSGSQKRDREVPAVADDGGDFDVDDRAAQERQVLARRAVDLATISSRAARMKDPPLSSHRGADYSNAERAVASGNETILCQDLLDLDRRVSAAPAVLARGSQLLAVREFSGQNESGGVETSVVDGDRSTAADWNSSALHLEPVFAMLNSSRSLAWPQKLDAHQLMCARSIVASVWSELSQGSPGCRVGVIASCGPPASDYVPSEVPMQVTVPRTAWFFISFILRESIARSLSVDLQTRGDDSVAQWMMALMCKFFAILYAQTVDRCDQAPHGTTDVYDLLCLATMARLLQIGAARPLAAAVLQSLPQVPQSCLSLLKLVARTGPKHAASGEEASSRVSGISSTRQLGLVLLKCVVFSSDHVSGLAALDFLLWCSVSQDFELRCRAVNFIVSDVYTVDEWCDDRICLFAMKAVAAALCPAIAEVWAVGLASDSRRYLKDVSSAFVAAAVDVLEKQDDGACFAGGQFSSVFAKDCSDERVAKQATHLLFHLCRTNLSMLSMAVDLFVAASAPVPESSWSLRSYLEGEVRSSVLYLQQHHSAETVFDAAAYPINRDNHSSRAVVVVVLDALLADFTVPPSSSMVAQARQLCRASSGGDELVLTSSEAPVEVPLAEIPLDEDFRMMLPLIGALPAHEVEAGLPRLLRVFAGNADALRIVFSRIVKCRPPPLSRAALLVALHRVPCESEELKPKVLLDALAVCLNNKTDFSAEVVKDALRSLLQDEEPAFALMRTAILAAQSFPEVKKFVLSEVVPSLVRRRAWSVAPKVWDGVVFAVKTFATAAGVKTSEQTLKSVMSIPGAQLRAVIKAAPTIVVPLAKLLRSLSESEREEVLSGRFSGLPSVASGDSEKLLVVREILAALPAQTAA